MLLFYIHINNIIVYMSHHMYIIMYYYINDCVKCTVSVNTQNLKMFILILCFNKFSIPKYISCITISSIPIANYHIIFFYIKYLFIVT